MKIEIGAGAHAHDGYIAVDINPAFADIEGDALHLPFEDGTVTAIRAVDVLEHISYRETDAALAEWARVSAPGCDLYVQVPDAAEIMRWYIDNDDARIRTFDRGNCPAILGAAWRLLGGHADGRYVDGDGDWRWNAHYSLWDREWLATCLDHAGFDVVEIVTNAHPNLCCNAVRT